MLHIINIYRYLQIPRIFARGRCCESAKAVQSLHPGLKIMKHSWQILRHAPACPRGYPPLLLPPFRMAADKCIIIFKFSDLHWPYVLQVCIILTYSISGRLQTKLSSDISNWKVCLYIADLKVIGIIIIIIIIIIINNLFL